MKLLLCSVAWTGCGSWEHPAHAMPAPPPLYMDPGHPHAATCPPHRAPENKTHLGREFHLQVFRFWIILPNPLQYYELFSNLSRVFLWTLPMNSAVICIVMGRAAWHGKNLSINKCWVLGSTCSRNEKSEAMGLFRQVQIPTNLLAAEENTIPIPAVVFICTGEGSAFALGSPNFDNLISPEGVFGQDNV